MSTDPTTEAESYDEYSVDDETQLQPEDTLLEPDPATGVDDPLDRGYTAPEKWSAAQRYGNTPWEQAHDRPLDDRLAEEEPDVEGLGEPTDGAEDDGVPHEAADGSPEGERDEPEELGQAGGERAGRLVAGDGVGYDADDVAHDQDVVAEDLGIDGAAASAEEAAMHVVDPDEDDALDG